MLTLSPRLMACARLVSGAGCCCDVGTDHAYLPVYLLQRGICTSVIASDIGEGPLQSARQTAARWGVSEGIRIIRSDGLQQIPKEGVTDVVIAGMGAETICDILEHGDWLRRGTNLILQPMTRTPLLRRWLSAHGFALYREIPVQEEQRLYTVLQAGYTGEVRALSPLEEMIGRLDDTDPLARAYALRQAETLRKKAAGLNRAGKPAEQEEALAAELTAWAERKEQTYAG